MKSIVKNLIENLLPDKIQLFIRFHWMKIRGKLDVEMLYITKILKRKRTFLDIGANVGIYSYYYSKYFNNIVSFEPISELTYRLKSLKNKKITIHHTALSNTNGILDLHIPIENGKQVTALSTLEDRYTAYQKKKVIVKKLDEYKIADVDLIKIDVEGHEEHVIAGGLQTIVKYNPLLIIEIEQRHLKKDIKDIFNILKKLNYEGFFLKNGNLEPLYKFNYVIDQKPYLDNFLHKNYINNFIFIPKKVKK
tara:strand:+ start:59 stop:808 length:750 start_codon:yes stop_codon:yes gene_type:complete